MFRFFRACLLSHRFWLGRSVLMILCYIHEFTKYRTARSFAELFYWPDGLCMDMVVVAAFFATALWCIYGDLIVLMEESQNGKK